MKVKRSSVVFQPMQKPKGALHPSGRPLANVLRGTTTRTRVPCEPLSPGLQKRELQSAIGFGVDFAADDE